MMQGADFGFVGEAYEAPMLLQDSQRCVNWYCEISEDKTNGSKMPIALLGCPGLQQIAVGSNSQGVFGGPVIFGTGDGSTKAFNTGDTNLILETVYVNDWEGLQTQYTTPRTNLATFSQDGTHWTALNSTITAGQAGAPDGSSTLNKVAQTAANNLHQASSVGVAGTSALGTYSARWIVHSGSGANFAECVMADQAGGDAIAIFNFTTNKLVVNPYAISTASIGAWTILSTTSYAIGSGCYAIEMQATKGDATNPIAIRFRHNNGSTDFFSGNAANFFYGWGLMITSGAVLGTYIPTTSANVTLTDYSVNIATANFTNAPVVGASLEKQTFTPGTGGTAIRGMWALPGGTSALVVAGSVVYLLSVALAATSGSAATFNYTQIGTLLTSVGTVSIRDNGVVFGGQGGYAVIVDGQFGYYYLLSGQPNVISFTGGVTSGQSTVAVSSIPNGLVATTNAVISGTNIPNNTTFTGVNFNTVVLNMSANATGTNAAETITVTIPVFGQITDPAFLPASMIAFIEGWLIFSEPATRTFFTNAATPYTLLFAGSFFALKDSSTDNLVTLHENNRELWLIGERTSEVWYNAGNPNFAFARIPAIGPQIGCAATHSITRLGSDLVWLGRNEQGQNIVVRQNNYDWQKISTHAIDKAIGSYAVTSDAIGFAYEEDGHWFYVLTFPTADATWVYDGKTSMWHSRASFDPTAGLYHRVRANAFCNLSDTRLVGDYQNGQIYQMSRQFYSDNGAPLRCQRRAPHIWEKQNRKRIFHSWLQVEFTPGIGLSSGQGSNPQAMLRWYDYNKNKNWSNEHWVTIGQTGQVGNRAIWRRLGSSRDRIYELNISDPVPRDVIGVTLFAEAEDENEAMLSRTA